MPDNDQTELWERRYSRVLSDALDHLNEEVDRRQAALDGATTKLRAIKALRDRVQQAVQEASDREAATAPGPDALSDEEAAAARFCIGSECRQYVADGETGICGKVPGLNMVQPGETRCPTVPEVDSEPDPEPEPEDGVEYQAEGWDGPPEPDPEPEPEPADGADDEEWEYPEPEGRHDDEPEDPEAEEPGMDPEDAGDE